ncbi:hypothetical protein F2P81_005949 [Scophthalmus maximus]|uniref:Uncharacterized protein n=1 Tax=Scophthalmus maximus TaxID=52904 RepID=A0A6A4T7X7_SCOMX|nr:hypothetical protein F2P81_005949 [Scophthalmus maximus]
MTRAIRKRHTSEEKSTGSDVKKKQKRFDLILISRELDEKKQVTVAGTGRHHDELSDMTAPTTATPEIAP